MALRVRNLVAGAASVRRAFHTSRFALSAANEDVVSFPRESDGNNYALNWALCGHGVVPKSAYRNLTADELTKRGAKGVAASGAAASAIANVGELPPFAAAAHKVMSSSEFKQHTRATTRQLEAAETVFVADGFVGSSASCQVPVRVVSDDASVVAEAGSYLHAAPQGDADSFTPSVAVLVASGSEGGVVAHDLNMGQVVAKGAVSTTAVQDAIGLQCGQHVRGRGLPLSCDSGDGVLVFGPDREDRKNVLKSATGSRLHFWGQQGVSRGFNNGSGGEELPHPKAIVFMSTSPKGKLPDVASLTAEQAQFQFLVGLAGPKGESTPCFAPPAALAAPPADLAANFGQLVTESKASVYLVNVAGKDASAAKALVEKAISGKAEKLTQAHVAHLAGEYAAAVKAAGEVPADILKGGFM